MFPVQSWVYTFLYVQCDLGVKIVKVIYIIGYMFRSK